MQEGTPAFVQMIRISAAIAAHKTAGLPYLVYLRHPTTGGVMASWGSLGHITVAEPGALVGFLGPRVYEALYDEHLPRGRADRGEPLRARHRRRRRTPRGDRRASCDRALTHALAPARSSRSRSPPVEEIPDVDAWESITRSRRTDRPGVRRLLRYAATDVIPLNGTGAGRGRPRPADRAGPLRRLPLRLPRPGPTRPDPRRPARARARCARPAAACGWPSSSGCRWSP